MTRNTRDVAKRNMAQVIFHLTRAQEDCSELWFWAKDDPRHFGEAFSACMETMEEVKETLAALTDEMFQLTPAELETWRN